MACIYLIYRCFKPDSHDDTPSAPAMANSARNGPPGNVQGAVGSPVGGGDGYAGAGYSNQAVPIGSENQGKVMQQMRNKSG